MPTKDIKRLSEVINYIKNVIDSGLGGRHIWLKSELSNINFHRSGHCYVDLVENENGQTLAQCRATIWKFRLAEIRSSLGDDFKNIVKKGAEVLLQGEVVFHAVYGLSINILAIDPTYSLGELERKKQETLKKLETLQLLERNQEVPLPTVIQRIAIVGSPGTSGHTDFLKMLERNEHHFDFRTDDFPCQVQGDHAAGEIIARLKELQHSDYDVVVLIRGGGSKLDLEVFNAFLLAKAIALHDKPVLTGIGHETDVSVADVVAHRQFKTPSAVGAFIVDRAFRFYVDVNDHYKSIRKFYERFMRDRRHQLEQDAQRFETRSVSYTQLRRGELHRTANRINTLAGDLLSVRREAHRIEAEALSFRTVRVLEEKQQHLKNAWELAAMAVVGRLSDAGREVKHQRDVLASSVSQQMMREQESLARTGHLLDVYHPDRTLERGWAVVRMEGQLVKTDTELAEGDELEVELHDRKLLVSFIKETKKWKDLLTKALQKS